MTWMPESHQLDAVDTEWLNVGRAVGGAVIFGLPLMMTMEMWWLGLHIDPLRLLCLLLISLPVFVKISSVIGFTESRELVDNIVDVFVAYAFGFVISALSVFLFAVLEDGNSISINLTAVALLAIPACLGALLGRSELGSGEHDRTDEKSRSDEIAVLAVGALFLAFNVAPTDEIALISYQMSTWHLLGLFLTTLLVMYVFVVAGSYSSTTRDDDAPDSLTGYLCYTCMACLVAASVSLFMLWVFGRTEGLSFTAIVSCTIVLLFPAGIGAAAARLII